MNSRSPQKVVAAQSYRVRVYRRTGDAACLFVKRRSNGMSRALPFEKSRSKRYKACSDVVGMEGLEPKNILKYTLLGIQKSPNLSMFFGFAKIQNKAHLKIKCVL